MRLSIDHQTGFRYDSPVRASYNEARMTPLTRDGQTVWTNRITIEPTALELQLRRLLGHDGHHVRAARAARTAPRARPGRGRHPRRRDRLGHRTSSPAQRPRLGRAARPRRDRPDDRLPRGDQPDHAAAGAGPRAADVAGQAPRLAGLDVCRIVHDHLRYRRGSTTVNSTAAEVWELGTGVCQDFTHVALGALRSIGLPARYVSGYLHPGGTQGGDGHRREPLLGRVVVRHLGLLRPHAGPAPHRPVRAGRAGPRLRRRRTAARDLLGRRVGDVRDRVDDRAGLCSIVGGTTPHTPRLRSTRWRSRNAMARVHAVRAPDILGAMSNPYGQQPPYGQSGRQPNPYGQPQPGPYGQPQGAPYGQPQGYGQPRAAGLRPVRPAAAVGAAHAAAARAAPLRDAGADDGRRAGPGDHRGPRAGRVRGRAQPRAAARPAQRGGGRGLHRDAPRLPPGRDRQGRRDGPRGRRGRRRRPPLRLQRDHPVPERGRRVRDRRQARAAPRSPSV